MGWLDLLLSGHAADLRAEKARIEARNRVFAQAELDRQRAEAQRRRDRRIPWRWHEGRWERWSELDAAFVPGDPPGTLLDHAAAHDGPVEDEALVFDGERWVPDDPAGDTATAAPVSAPIEPGDGAGTVTEAAQIEAWRRRSRRS